jgi:uncharacterized protein (DUF305 family)
VTPVRLAALVVFTLCAGALRAAEEPAHDHAAMGHDHGGAAPGALTGLYSVADLTFLTHMIVHHQQALDLCALVNERSSREQLRRFSRYLNDAQQAEIDQMKGLLEQAAVRGATIPQAHFAADPPMAGMLSRAQMAAITAARGAQFEQLWLQGMILHHQGAVDMALAQQEAQFRNRNQPFGLDTMVDDMLAVQRGEIGMMQGWLTTWR